MKRAHAAIFLLFVVDKLVFFFYFEMEYEGILVLASQYEKYKTKTKKLVPKKKKNAFYLLWAYYNLSTFGLAEIYVAYL